MRAAEHALRTLFGDSVEVCAMDASVTPDRSHPDEACAIENAIAKRRDEFARGRMCAKAAVRKLTARSYTLPCAPDRTPVWPRGIVGSIAHCAGLCCAVAGASPQWTSLGVDVEVVQAMPDSRLVLTRRERAFCTATSIDPLIVFGAKEAFYKCHFPLFRTFLRFHDVHMDIDQAAPFNGIFRATILDAAMPGAAAAPRIKGAWLVDGGFLFCAAALES
jgi:4'-phosphopantetheinyl transferase EntD